MNPLLITSVLIISVIIYILFFVQIVKLKKELKEYKELTHQQNQDKQDLRTQLKGAVNEARLAQRSKDITTLLLKKIVASIINKHRGNLINDLFPFEYATTIENALSPLNSIRFKKSEDKGLVYINGAMVPTNKLIQLVNYTCLDKDDLDLYTKVLQNLEAIAKKEKTVDNLELFLN